MWGCAEEHWQEQSRLWAEQPGRAAQQSELQDLAGVHSSRSVRAWQESGMEKEKERLVESDEGMAKRLLAAGGTIRQDLFVECYD